ncbi:hypothetical protein PGB90_005598 [Kerria lacca]
MNSVESFVLDTIKSEKIVIFSKSYCPFCKMAKEAFDKINASYFTVELDERNDGEAIQDILLKLTGARSVPRVFVNEKFIGGGTDVKKLQEKGELQKIISGET